MLDGSPFLEGSSGVTSLLEVRARRDREEAENRKRAELEADPLGFMAQQFAEVLGAIQGLGPLANRIEELEEKLESVVADSADGAATTLAQFFALLPDEIIVGLFVGARQHGAPVWWDAFREEVSASDQRERFHQLESQSIIKYWQLRLDGAGHGSTDAAPPVSEPTPAVEAPAHATQPAVNSKLAVAACVAGGIALGAFLAHQLTKGQRVKASPRRLPPPPVPWQPPQPMFVNPQALTPFPLAEPPTYLSATDAQVELAAEQLLPQLRRVVGAEARRYMTSNAHLFQGERGPMGPQGLPGRSIRGPRGRDGANVLHTREVQTVREVSRAVGPTKQQISRAVAKHMKQNRTLYRGEKGEDGVVALQRAVERNTSGSTQAKEPSWMRFQSKAGASG